MGARFADRVVLVTGASRGIGSATATAFASEGARVAVNYRSDADGARRTCEAAHATGGVAQAFQADITNEADVAALHAAVIDTLGPIDVLVNNAAAINRGHFLDVTLEQFDEVWRFVRATYQLSQLAAAGMVERRRGAIVHLSSILATLAVPTRTAYCAAKGAIESLTRAMALDLAPFGVRVNCVAPGLVATDALFAGFPTDEARDDVQRYIPGGRFGRPDEIAAAILFAASDEATYLNGAVLPVDAGLGGREAGPPAPTRSPP